MNFTLEEYFNLQDALFHLNNVEKDEKRKNERIELKKSLSKSFKKTFPKGITAETYKNHTEGKSILTLQFQTSDKEQTLVTEAQRILSSGEKIWHAIPAPDEVIVEVV